MKPKPHHAREGRLNPAGISYLYAATDSETAVSEVRPWHSALVSVAQMRVVQLLNPISILAQTDLTNAYNLLASQLFTSNLSGQDLGTIGLLDAGVYRFNSTAVVFQARVRAIRKQGVVPVVLSIAGVANPPVTMAVQ